MPKPRLLVGGGRDFADVSFLFKTLDELHRQHRFTDLVQGGARGADALAKDWARTHPDIKHVEMKADWKRYDPAAGPMRNQRMLDWRPDLVVAFAGGSTSSAGACPPAVASSWSAAASAWASCCAASAPCSFPLDHARQDGHGVKESFRRASTEAVQCAASRPASLGRYFATNVWVGRFLARCRRVGERMVPTLNRLSREPQ
jgi:hypothetical protein